MVRILLVLTVLALLGGGFIAMNNVQGRINGLSTDLANTQNTLSDKVRDLETAQNALKTAEDAMIAAQKNEKEAKDNLTKAGRELVVQRDRADRHEADLDKERAALVDARNFSESWRLFQKANGTKEQITQKLATLSEVSNQRDNFLAENTILLSQIKKLGVELSRYTGTSVKVTLPQNLHGTVTAVDTQFDFVVLDIGENQGVLEYGELLVSRGEKLIGKLRILDVKQNHSIANILPDWKQGEEIQKGDIVIVGN
ncbi:MAG: hypothetical protein ACI8QI_000824 [Limisphaerales bacterium]|jgi:hypothetical protein